MKIAYVYNEIPNKEHSTDLYCSYLIHEAFLDAGHEVDLVILYTKKPNIGNQKKRLEWLARLKGKNVRIHFFPGDPVHGKKEKNNQFRFFQHASLSADLNRFLKKLSPELVFTWGNWPPAASLYEVDVAPKVAFLGDLPFEPAYFRTQYPHRKVRSSLIQQVKEKWHFRKWKKETKCLLKSFDKVAFTSHHYAEWSRNNGISQAEWLPNIVPDWGGEDWLQKRSRKSKEKLKIVMLGNLTTTSNYSGLYYLMDKILPELKRSELLDHFEFNLCGKAGLSQNEKQILESYGVKIRGFVDDIIQELMETDIFLVTTPIPLGIRVRIPYAWSTGCCVVAHEANSKGLPYTTNGKNIFYANTAKEFQDCFMKLYQDRELIKRLGRAGRETFEKYFSEKKTKSKILHYFLEKENVA